jgi:hypothetical protein
MHAQETSCSKMWRISLTVAVAAMAFAALAAVPEAFAKDNDKDQKGAELGPGCAPDRPAIAHHAGGILAGTDKVEEAPIPSYIPHIAGGIWRQFPRLTAPELGNQGSRGCSASISRSV